MIVLLLKLIEARNVQIFASFDAEIVQLFASIDAESIQLFVSIDAKIFNSLHLLMRNIASFQSLTINLNENEFKYLLLYESNLS